MGLEKSDIFSSVTYFGLFEEYPLDFKPPSAFLLKKKKEKQEEKIQNISVYSFSGFPSIELLGYRKTKEWRKRLLLGLGQQSFLTQFVIDWIHQDWPLFI
ncbi:hypothetical protein ACOSQ4_004157 [Xanthoceras sorbifolium]